MRTRSATRGKRGRTSRPAPERIVKNGRRLVLVDEAEYERLRMKADEWEPLLPEPLPDGNYPAEEFMVASIARAIVRQRRRAGLTQVELARRAGISPETLNRIEHCKRTPSVATVDKIDRALRAAERA